MRLNLWPSLQRLSRSLVPASVSTPDYLICPDPDRLRKLADWLADECEHGLSAAAHRAALELDRKPRPANDRPGFSEGPRRDG